MRTRIFNHEFSISLNALHKWSHFKLHKRGREYPTTHLVWGRLSVLWGQGHLEPIQVCPHCHAAVERLGEDLIDYCSEGCGCIEGEKSVWITTEEYENA